MGVNYRGIYKGKSTVVSSGMGGNHLRMGFEGFRIGVSPGIGRSEKGR
jgi:hypothetical protein